MTTDITELAPAMKAAAEKASGGDWVKESGDGWDATCSNDDQANSGFIIAHFVGPDSAANREFVQLANPANILALVEALEKAQSVAAVDWEAAASLNVENQELKRRIAELESRTVTVKQYDEFQICHYGATEDYAKGYIDCQNNFSKWLTAAGIKWEAE